MERRVRAILLASTAWTLTTLTTLPVVTSARAADWNNPGIGNWSDPANWSGSQVPGSADHAIVDRGTAQVGNGEDAFSYMGFVGAHGAGTIEVAGAGSTWTIETDLFAGDYDYGTLKISDGAAVDVGGNAYMGTNPASTGIVTVTGADSALTVAHDAYVGFTGTGTLEIRNGGTMSDGNGYLGNSYGSTGNAVVDGTGSSWTSTNAFIVAKGGAGTLAITNGGRVSSGYGVVGYSATGVVTVDGAGSNWSTGDLTIGEYGTGTLTIANGGTVDAEDVRIAAYGGSQGTLNIGAAAGETAVAAGALNADTITFGGGTGTLVFNHTNTDYSLDADISGAGTIFHMGSGTTTLTGDGGDFGGVVRLSNGELIVDRALGGHVIVTGSGRLGGEGWVGQASAIEGGVIAPGRKRIGTLAVASGLYMDAGATYEVEITSGSSDLIQVGGTAFVEGAGITIKRGMGPIVLGAGYTILSADEGFSGAFGEIASDYAFITPSLVYIPDFYGSDLVTLEFARNGVAFADVAASANQAAVAEALGTNGAIHNIILSLNEAEAQAAFDALAGEGHATIEGILMENTELVSDALLHRLDALRSALDSAGVASGYAAPPELADDGSGGNGVWGQVYGGLGHRAGDGNAAAATFGAGGLIVGADAAVADWDVGLSAQVGATEVSIADRATEGTSTDIGAGFYAGTNWGDTGFSVAGMVIRHVVSTSREVGFALDETLTADYGATTGQVVAELDHTFDFGAVGLTPFAQVGHRMHATEGFTEAGGDAALSSADDVVNQSFATLGLRGAYQFVVGEGGLATISGGIGWRRGFGETPTAQNGFIGGSPFAVTAAPAAPNTLLLETGLDLDLANGLDVSVRYAGDVSEAGQAHAVKLGVVGQF